MKHILGKCFFGLPKKMHSQCALQTAILCLYENPK